MLTPLFCSQGYLQSRLLARKLAAVRGSVNPEEARPFFNTLAPGGKPHAACDAF